MSEKRFKWIDKDTISDNQTDEWYCFLFDDIRDDFVDLLNEEQSKIRELEEENERLKEQVQILNKCCGPKLSDKAIKQAYAELNRREIEKHSQGNAAYTAKINQNEVVY